MLYLRKFLFSKLLSLNLHRHKTFLVNNLQELELELELELDKCKFQVQSDGLFVIQNFCCLK